VTIYCWQFGNWLFTWHGRDLFTWLPRFDVLERDPYWWSLLWLGWDVQHVNVDLLTDRRP
jgi:hypothetical protein